MGSGQSLEDQVFELRFNAKQLARESGKCAKAEKAERLKVKKAIQAGNNDIARIHAENAIRQKSQSLNFLRLSSRMEAVSQRLKSAASIQTLNKNMVGVNKTLKTALQKMDLEQISKTMDKFEQNLEEMDITSSVMESSIQQGMGSLVQEDHVDGLLREVADEHGLEIQQDLDDASVPRQQREVEQEEDDLERRFNELKQGN